MSPPSSSRTKILAICDLGFLALGYSTVRSRPKSVSNVSTTGCDAQGIVVWPTLAFFLLGGMMAGAGVRLARRERQRATSSRRRGRLDAAADGAVTGCGVSQLSDGPGISASFSGALPLGQRLRRQALAC